MASKKIKKRLPAQSKGGITKAAPFRGKMAFSFALFDNSDFVLCPPVFPETYTQVLMERLAAISQMTEHEFRQAAYSLRSHAHDWSRTIRPDGFTHLNDQLRDYPGWQFCLSANQHGRVHGIVIDNIFFVIWLDFDHALYP